MTDYVVDLTPTEAQRVNANKARAALAEFFEARPPGPLYRTAWMGDGYIEASLFNNRAHLSAVFVLPDVRGRKLGSSYLDSFLAIMDKHGAEVECSVKPFGDQVAATRKGVRELTKWYKSRGFVSTPNRSSLLYRPAAS